ncbi:MAG TPA: DegT/DnrJ/EryC1/StrS family aminotransferase, partial [Gaiellaceae bacterium]|nr:DegT/DnrJ/EryC1/StrS family aminotransferase [Gaiellaceae bacterium]
MSVPFLDLARETTRLRSQIQVAIDRVLASGRFVLTEEDEAFEHAFAGYCDTTQAVGVASGTDAITIALLACGVEPGDEVITAPNTCVPT